MLEHVDSPSLCYVSYLFGARTNGDCDWHRPGNNQQLRAIMESGKPRVITVNDGATQVPSVFAVDSDGNDSDSAAKAKLSKTRMAPSLRPRD